MLLDIIIEQPALFPLEGFAFTPEAPLTGIFQCLFPLLDIACQCLASLCLRLLVHE
ncbi:hypothetical protein M5J15_02555 [Serratia symbiotica]|uniref:hypothetical protein n=1 Tax=Serratia symbiotica TaxID=138074 RepID=UPI001D95DDA3|nr:hypothetical protein [Serratia symbiotica]NIG87547.1 hypothetical protein [Serratia symbiotica]USS96071.1 hypothetical protein M5J15_02555 [Serratia symbiotica]